MISVSEKIVKTHSIRSLEQLDLLKERMLESFKDEKVVTVLILENEKETNERFSNLLHNAVKEMEEYHQKSHKEFEKKHIENYIKKRYGHIKKIYINQLFKDLEIL